MGSRLELHDVLKAIAGDHPVYFQPPGEPGMKYPCIVYERDGGDTTFADNVPYQTVKRYSVTVIDADPDSAIPDQIAKLPMCAPSQAFRADNLNHDVFTLFF